MSEPDIQTNVITINKGNLLFVPVGKTVSVTLTLNRRSFAWWNNKRQTWQVDTGAYEIQIYQNARDVLLSRTVHVESTDQIKPHFTVNTPMGDIFRNPVGAQILGTAFASMGQQTEAVQQEDSEDTILNAEAQAAMSQTMPLRSFVSYAPGSTRARFQQLIDAVNGAIQNR